jgi:hypothetical protein
VTTPPSSGSSRGAKQDVSFVTLLSGHGTRSSHDELSHQHQTLSISLDNLSPRGLWRLPRSGIRFLGGFDGVLLSPKAQLFCGLAIATAVCGGGHRGVLALSFGVFHLTVPRGGQSNTAQKDICFASKRQG